MGLKIIIGDVFKITVKLTYAPIDFYEQASNIRGSQTNVTVSPRSSLDLLAMFNNTIARPMDQ
jgi:hypothetical protein